MKEGRERERERERREREKGENVGGRVGKENGGECRERESGGQR